MSEEMKRPKSTVSTTRTLGEREAGDEAKSALLDKADRMGIFEYLSDTKPFSHPSPQRARERLAALDIDKLKTTLDGHQDKARKHLLSREPEAEPVKKDRKKLEEHLARLQGTTADDEFKENYQYLSPDELEKEIKATVNANARAKAKIAEEKKRAGALAMGGSSLERMELVFGAPPLDRAPPLDADKPTGTVGARQMKRPTQGGIPLTKKSGYTKLDMRHMEARDGGLGWKIIFWVFAVGIPVGLISSMCESITGS